MAQCPPSLATVGDSARVDSEARGCSCAPLDQATHAQFTYSSAWDCLVKTAQRSGVRSLFLRRGVQAHSTTYGTLVLVAYTELARAMGLGPIGHAA